LIFRSCVRSGDFLPGPAERIRLGAEFSLSRFTCLRAAGISSRAHRIALRPGAQRSIRKSARLADFGTASRVRRLQTALTAGGMNVSSLPLFFGGYSVPLRIIREDEFEVGRSRLEIVLASERGR